MPLRKTQYNDLRIITQQRSHINQTHINDHKSQIQRLIKKKKKKSQIHRVQIEIRGGKKMAADEERVWQIGRENEQIERGNHETQTE